MGFSHCGGFERNSRISCKVEQNRTGKAVAREVSRPPIREGLSGERKIFPTANPRTCSRFNLSGRDHLPSPKNKQRLTSVIQNTPVIRNARREAGVLNPETNEYLEFDIFIPSLNLAIEFNVSPCFCLHTLTAPPPTTHYTTLHTFSEFLPQIGETSLQWQCVCTEAVRCIPTKRQRKDRIGHRSWNHTDRSSFLVGSQIKQVIPFPPPPQKELKRLVLTLPIT